ncbi:unnamed protein product [Dovyalis caffra]|uniref:Uncharacterized protein n=1 Tax=Dovyalis caffra TaxID=77055 RepID=A0AAV1R5E9_9ROSI|nr:unnamed protein product [Dovyalis caffra]
MHTSNSMKRGRPKCMAVVATLLDLWKAGFHAHKRKAMEKVKELRRVWVYKLESGDKVEGVVTWVGWGMPYNPLVRVLLLGQYEHKDENDSVV